MSDALDDHCWTRRSALMYKLRVSILYHLLRERFLDQTDKAVSILTALAATSAVGSLIGTQGTFAKTITAATAVLSLIPLVLNPAGASKRHGQIAGEFRKLLAECERLGEHWTVSVCDEMSARLTELEAQEPAPLCALLAHCQNHYNLGGGEIVHLTWLQKRLKHIIAYDAAGLAQQRPAHPNNGVDLKPGVKSSRRLMITMMLAIALGFGGLFVAMNNVLKPVEKIVAPAPRQAPVIIQVPQIAPPTAPASPAASK